MAERWFDGTFFKRTKLISYSDTDTNKEVFIHMLLSVFSEIAGDEGISNGQLYEFFSERGMVFLITRMSARIHRRPRREETVVFTTWFRETKDNVFFLRDCDVRSEAGELLVSMSGTWVLLDMSTRRMLGQESYPGVMSLPHPEKLADAPECVKILPSENMESLGERPVYYTDLDLNSHINNAVYTRIAVDFLPEKYRGRRLRDYIINFKRETRLGEVLELKGGAIAHGYVIMGYVGDALHFASEFTFDD